MLVMSHRFLAEKQSEEIAEKLFEDDESSSSSPEDPFHDSEFSDEDYKPEESDVEENSESNSSADHRIGVESDSSPECFSNV
ncbi:hypothetical protein JTB14_003716 [Gonioctena quinquepunctata]|nr:hypothetical protein JTB14_003716 [Gonioctena quinquepunctata]